MTTESTERSESRAQIGKFARFAILTTLAFMVLLSSADFIGHHVGIKFMSEQVLITFVYVVGIEVVAAIAAFTFLALWKS